MSELNTYRIMDDNKALYEEREADSVEDAVRDHCEEHYFQDAMGTEEIELQVIDPDGVTHDVTVDVDVRVDFLVTVL